MSVIAQSALQTDAQTCAAIAVCREITRTRAGNFYWGLRLTPEPRRSAMYAIYAWMREADDIVDGQVFGAQSGATSRANSGASDIHAFRSATVDALAGRSLSDKPIWRALSAVAREYPLDSSDFHSMID